MRVRKGRNGRGRGVENRHKFHPECLWLLIINVGRFVLHLLASEGRIIPGPYRWYISDASDMTSIQVTTPGHAFLRLETTCVRPQCVG